jgi:mRNA-degrading endonuclease RelE of RelBE toxin-antitoxin system
MNSYSQDIDEELVSKLRKLAKRDKTLYTTLQKKMVQITENPYLGKPLRGILK